MNRSRQLVLGGALALLLATAPAAHAVTRYASPGGSMALGTCNVEAAPCELQNAMGAANNGDVVQLAAGTYTDSGGDGYELAKPITLRGAPGDRPLLKSTTNGEPALDLTQVNASNAQLDHLAFESTGSGATAVNSGAGAMGLTIKDSTITSAGSCIFASVLLLEDVTMATTNTATLCAQLSGPGTIRRVGVTAPGSSLGLILFSGIDSEDVRVDAGGIAANLVTGTHRRWSVVSSANSGIAFNGSATLTDSFVRAQVDGIAAASGSNPTLRNITVSAQGRGIVASGEDFIGGPASVVRKNVIARGAGGDLYTASIGICPSPPCDPGSISLSYSNVTTPVGPGITYGAGMQSGDPLFVSATDLHIQPTSPAKDAGDVPGVDSLTDIDGQTRVAGSSVDIGADEIQPPPPDPPTGPPVIPPPAKDTKAPGVTRVRAVAKGTIGFTIDEAATVTITAERATAGKRKGKKCVKPTKALRRAKRCTLYVKAGTVKATVKAGTVRQLLRFGKKTASPGAYRLTITAVDAARNTSKALRVNVTLPKR